MSDPTRALRGAVDLSGLGDSSREPGATPTTPSAPAGAPAPGGAPAAGGRADGVLVEATDETFNQIVARTSAVPALAVVWSSQHPSSRTLLDDAVDIASGLDGRLQIVGIDLVSSPGVQQAL